MEKESISRRGFLTGALAAGAIVGVAGLSGCSPAPSPSNTTDGAHPWLVKPDPITDFVAEEDYDIVVIGAGIAGVSAAHAAAEAGAKTICIEKFEGFTAHGADICAVGSKLQKEQGVDIDKALATRLIYQWGQSETNFYLIKTFVERSGEVMDRFLDLAPKYGYEVILNTEMTARSDWDTLEDRFKQFRTAHKFVLPEGSAIEPRIWNTGYFIDMLIQDSAQYDATFSYNTEAKQLVRTGDAVSAVIVEDVDGYKKINASKGIILATGGITDNAEMIECFCPIAARCDHSEYFPIGGNLGDGITMGKWIGAQLSPCYPAPIIHPVNLAVMGPGFDTSWLSVNRDGMRYCCEVGYEPIVTNARMNTPGSVAWAIFDSHYKEHAQRQEPIKSASFLEGLDEAVEEAVSSGAFYKADTLAGLAAQLGIPADALQKTIDRYNGFCDKGEDPDFGVPARFLSSVKDGPFYASNVSAWLLALPYGLRVNQDSQVLDDEDTPIGNLFAIGNVQGDFFANSYPVTLPGTSHGRGVLFGHLVGEAAAKGTTISGYSVGF